MENIIIRITPAWKQELEHIKADLAAEGSVVSLSEIVRQQLGPWLKDRIAKRQALKDEQQQQQAAA